MKCKALSVRSDSLLSAKMTAVLCLLLLMAAQLASSWPLSVCPEDTGSEIVLNGLEQDVLVSPPVSARRGVQLQTCRLRPGATITRSIVFQGAKRLWFEFSLPPIILLEVDCDFHDVNAEEIRAAERMVVCARCGWESRSDQRNDTGSGGANQDLVHQHNFAVDPSEGLPRERRLRRSAAPQSERSDHSRTAILIVTLSSVASLIMLVILCGSKSKADNGSRGQAYEAGSRPNDSDETPTANGNGPATAEPTASDQSGAEASGQATAGTDTEQAIGSDGTGGHEATLDASGAESNSPDGGEVKGEVPGYSPSPPYAAITKPGDNTIEESGGGLVVTNPTETTTDGDAYAIVDQRTTTAAQSAGASAAAVGNENDEDDDGPSYEQIFTTGPPPGRVRATSEPPPPSDKERHGSKSSTTLGRSLPDPVGEPAFLVPPAKMKPPTPSTDGLIEEDHMYSCVDAKISAKSKRLSDPYAQVDDEFRTKMKTVASDEDSPYARAFDDISEVDVDAPYSKVKSGDEDAASSTGLPKQSSVESADQDDHLYKDVFQPRKSGKVKSPVEEGVTTDLLYAKPSKPGTIPEEREETTTESIPPADKPDGEEETDVLYAKPSKAKSHTSAEVTEGIYEKPPELAPKGPEANVLESAVQHYEAGHEGSPVAGVPVHADGALYAMPGKGTVPNEQPPELQPRSEESNELVQPLDASGYSCVSEDELQEARRKIGSEAVPRQASLASVGSQPENEDSVETDHLYSAVSGDDLDDARKNLPATATQPATGASQERPKRHNGYSKVTDEVLAAPKDAVAGDPGYMEVDAALKEQLVRIREGSGAPQSEAAPKNVSRVRATTARAVAVSPPPALPTSQRPRAATMDALRSAHEKDLLKQPSKDE